MRGSPRTGTHARGTQDRDPGEGPELPRSQCDTTGSYLNGMPVSPVPLPHLSLHRSFCVNKLCSSFKSQPQKSHALKGLISHPKEVRDSGVPWMLQDVPLANNFFFLLGPHPRQMEVPRFGIESELQLLAYATVMPTAASNPSYICDLFHSLWQHEILNPLSKARN